MQKEMVMWERRWQAFLFPFIWLRMKFHGAGGGEFERWRGVRGSTYTGISSSLRGNFYLCLAAGKPASDTSNTGVWVLPEVPGWAEDWQGGEEREGGGLWHLSADLTGQKAAVVLTAQASGHWGPGHGAGLLLRRCQFKLSATDTEKGGPGKRLNTTTHTNTRSTITRTPYSY